MLGSTARVVQVSARSYLSTLKEYILRGLSAVKEQTFGRIVLVNTHLNYYENIEFGRVFRRMVGEGIQPEPMGRMIPQFVADYNGGTR